MRELTERDKALIIDGIPEAALVLFCPGLQGRGATLIDRSQNANHGTISGATWKRLPSGLWALLFDGNDSVSLAALGTNVAGLTIEAWLWVDALGTFGDVYHATRDVGTRLNADSANKVSFRVELNDGSRIVTQTSAAQIAAAATWYHLLGAYDRAGQTSIICVNGVSQTVTTTGMADQNALINRTGYLGANWNLSSFLTGRLGLPRIYTRGLTAAEALRHHTRERHLLGV